MGFQVDGLMNSNGCFPVTIVANQGLGWDFPTEKCVIILVVVRKKDASRKGWERWFLSWDNWIFLAPKLIWVSGESNDFCIINSICGENPFNCNYWTTILHRLVHFFPKEVHQNLIPKNFPNQKHWLATIKKRVGARKRALIATFHNFWILLVFFLAAIGAFG